MMIISIGVTVTFPPISAGTLSAVPVQSFGHMLVPLEELSPEVMHLCSPHKLSSGSNINLDVYQTGIGFAMVFRAD